MNKEVIYKNFLWKFAERIMAQAVTTIVSIVLARILAPKDYGAISLIMIFIAMANVVMTSGFGNALIQKKNADTLDFSTVFYFNLLFSIVVYIGIYFGAPGIAYFYELPILTPVLRVMGISVIISSINSIQHAFVSKQLLFKRFFWSTLFGTLLSGIVGVITAVNGAGVWALVAQYITNLCVDTIVLGITVSWRPTREFSFDRLKQLFSYGWKLFCSGFLDTGYNQLRSLIIGKMYTTAQLAYYDQGQKYPQLIVTNVNTSISSVLLPAISKEQENPDMVKYMTRKSVAVSSYVMWPLMMGLVGVAEPFVRILLTDKWLFCVPYLRIACFTYAFWPIHTANLEAIKAMGRSDLFFKMEIIKKVFGILLLLLAMKHGVVAIALTGIVNTLISCVVNMYPNKSLLNYKYSEQIKDMLPPMVLAGVMAIIVQMVSWVISNDILLLLVQIMLGAFIYVVGSIILKLKSFQYILNILMKKKQSA